MVSSRLPTKETLVVHYLGVADADTTELHLWQENSAFEKTIPGVPAEHGWMRFEHALYAELPYHFLFKNAALQPVWEHKEATRNIFLRKGAMWTIDGDGSERRLGTGGAWTLEGDHELFGRKPAATKNVTVEIASAAPDSALAGDITLDVWINYARSKTISGLRPNANGRWTFKACAEVIVSFRFHSGTTFE